MTELRSYVNKVNSRTLRLHKQHHFQLHWDTLKQDDYSTVGGDGGCRVGEARASTTSPVPDHKGFELQ